MDTSSLNSVHTSELDDSESGMDTYGIVTFIMFIFSQIKWSHSQESIRDELIHIFNDESHPPVQLKQNSCNR